MLLDDVTKAYIVCYCDPPDGGNSFCQKRKEVSIQQHCSFYVKSTNLDSCSNLRHDDYCGCFHASDFADGKPIQFEDVPNPPDPTGRNQTSLVPVTGGGEYTESHRDQVYGSGRRDRPYRSGDIRGRRDSSCAEDQERSKKKKYKFLDDIESDIDFEGVNEQYKALIKSAGWVKGRCPETDKFMIVDSQPGFKGPTEEMLEDAHDGDMSDMMDMYEKHKDELAKHTNVWVTPKFLDNFTDGESKLWDSKAVKEYLEILNEEYEGDVTVFYQPIPRHEDEIPYVKDGKIAFTVPVDHSGSVSKEEIEDLTKCIIKSNTENRLTWEIPIKTVVLPEHLQDCLDSLCGAWSEKYNLFLDMSDPNIYTIYKPDGHFISLRQLYNDGIHAAELDFKMRDGDSCFEEYGFEEFADMISIMLEQGR